MSDAPAQDLIDAFVGAAHGDFAQVKELLAQHPGLINRSASWVETAIEAAAQTGQVEIAEFLLEHGAPKGICTAAMLGHIEDVARALHQDPNQASAKGAHGISVLYHAVIRGQAGIAQMLLDYGADVNGGGGGSPAIHGAVMFDQPGMAEWLLARGADVNLLNYEKKTPLKAALDMKRNAVAEVLRAHGGKE
jgi:ankyrin repeat protein